MRRRELLVTVGTGLAMVALPIGSLARANHIKIDGNQPSAMPPNPAPASSQTIHADHITAQQIRADSIYAKRIDADHVHGQIHQSKDVKVGDTRGRADRLRSRPAPPVIGAREPHRRPSA